MVLFRAATHYQLISSIILATSLDEEADLHLLDLTDFEPELIVNIQKTNVFRNVFYSKEKHLSDEFSESDRKDLNAFLKRCEEYECIDSDEEYTALYGQDMTPNKLYFYHLVSKQKKAPAVYAIEDGTTSYCRDVITHMENDPIQHSAFGNKSYAANLRGLYLFSPELAAENFKVTLLKYPEFTEKHKNILTSIYGVQPSIKESFVFFTSCFTELGYTTNEIKLVEAVAEEVGKENLLIKLHPRATYDLYTCRGYKTMEANNVPWEVCVLGNDMQDKVLISIFSTATFSSHNLLGVPQGIIFLNKMYSGNFPILSSSSGFDKYAERALVILNKHEQQMYVPENRQQLHEMILHAKGRWINNG